MKKLILSTLITFSATSALAVDMNTCSFKNNPKVVSQLEVIMNASLSGKFDRKFLKACFDAANSCEEAFEMIVIIGHGITATANEN